VDSLERSSIRPLAAGHLQGPVMTAAIQWTTSFLWCGEGATTSASPHALLPVGPRDRPPVPFAHPWGHVAQWESAAFTRQRSEVRYLSCPRHDRAGSSKIEEPALSVSLRTRGSGVGDRFGDGFAGDLALEVDLGEQVDRDAADVGGDGDRDLDRDITQVEVDQTLLVDGALAVAAL
jgi:hypothetical protein